MSQRTLDQHPRHRHQRSIPFWGYTCRFSKTRNSSLRHPGTPSVLHPKGIPVTPILCLVSAAGVTWLGFKGLFFLFTLLILFLEPSLVIFYFSACLFSLFTFSPVAFTSGVIFLPNSYPNISLFLHDFLFSLCLSFFSNLAPKSPSASIPFTLNPLGD